MAGWVVGIREVRHIDVEIETEHDHGPRATEPKRVMTDLPPESWLRLLNFRVALPQNTGAGPCGTLARGASGGSWGSWWSFHHLVAPVRAYYATYEPPMRFGAKPGPRGRRTA
jgi:hypothetical protein